MRPITPGYIPELLFELGHDAIPQGLPSDGAVTDDEQAMQELTTAYITAMYYSALANQYFQSALPDDKADVEDRMPRLEIAFERSYADYTAAADWLAKNGGKFIATSTAKQYYDEVTGRDAGAIKNMSSFYSQKSE